MCITVNGNLKITGIAVILDGHLSMVTDMAVVHLTTEIWNTNIAC